MDAKNAFKVLGLFILWGALIALTWIAATPAAGPPLTQEASAQASAPPPETKAP